MLILGHRGAPDAALENTLRSIDRALSRGADGIECDLRATSDGEIVLLHDADLSRVAGRPERLRRLTARAVRSVELFGGLSIPTLDELLDLALDRSRRRGVPVFLDLELKDADIEDAVARVIRRRSEPLVRVLVTSFDARQMGRASRLGGPFETGLLDRGRRPRPVAAAGAAGCSWLCFGARSLSMAARARRAGLRTLVWTVDEPALAETYRELGVDALCTNAPELMASLVTTPPRS